KYCVSRLLTAPTSVWSCSTVPVSAVTLPFTSASEASTVAKRESTVAEKASSASITWFQSSARISSPALLPPNCSTNAISGLLSNGFVAEGEDCADPGGPHLLHAAEHPVERRRVERVVRPAPAEPDEHRGRSLRLPRG